MSIFDKLGKTITDTTHTVVEKTKSSTDTIRLNGLINDEERNMNAAYLNIGKKYAELHEKDAEPEFQEYLDAIAACQEKIEEYREQIRKNKHLLICQGCGAEIPETVLFCTKCGAENPVGKQLAEERAAKEAAERAAQQAAQQAQQAAQQAAAQQSAGGVELCQNCGKPRTPGAMFCTGCGTRFVPAQTETAANPIPAPAAVIPTPAPAEETATPTSEPVIPTPVPAEETAAPTSEPVIPTPVSAEETATPTAEPEIPAAATVSARTCPVCGKEVPAQYKFCTSCGTKMDETAVSAEPAAAPEKVCPVCGKTVPAQNKFCTSCGTKVAD